MEETLSQTYIVVYRKTLSLEVVISAESEEDAMQLADEQLQYTALGDWTHEETELIGAQLFDANK